MTPSQKFLRPALLLIGMIAYAVFFFCGIPGIPFHPDEATQIWMSGDVKTTLQRPAELAYSTHPDDELRQHYRLIDAPLARTMIGFGYLLTGQTPLASDWDWSAGWEENNLAGALPSADQLLIARLAVSIWMIPALYAFFRTLRRFTSLPVSLAGAAILALQAGLLLHTRRAMAEPLLLALYLFILWAIFRPYSFKNLIVVACLLGLVFQTKQTGLPLIAAVMIIYAARGWKDACWKGLAASILLPALAIILFACILNPVAWKNPLQVGGMMLHERLLFSRSQFSTLLEAGSGLALPGVPARLAGILAQVFIAPPAFYDVGNYAQELSFSIAHYQHSLFHHLFSGWVWGGILFTAVLASLVIAAVQLAKKQLSWYSPQVVMAFILTLHVIFFGAFLNIGFQRYYLPLVPQLLLLVMFTIGNLTARDKKQG